MRRVTAIQLNTHFAAFTDDPTGSADTFWEVLRAYVSWCSFSVPEWLRDDLIQDVTLEVMTHLEGFKEGSNFAKWTNSILHNMRSDRFRTHKYENPETPFSQLAIDDGDGGHTEFEPSTTTEPSDEADIPEQGEAEAVKKLDELRSGFKKQADRDLFDLLRTGKSLHDAADILHQPYKTIQRRFCRWKNVDLKVSPYLQFPDVPYRGNLQAA